MKLIHGYVRLKDLTINIQFNINNLCNLIKIPEFTISYYEEECLGNGWKSISKDIKVTEIINDLYAVINNNTHIAYIRTKIDHKAYLISINNKLYKNKYKN